MWPSSLLQRSTNIEYVLQSTVYDTMNRQVGVKISSNRCMHASQKLGSVSAKLNVSEILNAGVFHSSGWEFSKFCESWAWRLDRKRFIPNLGDTIRTWAVTCKSSCTYSSGAVECALVPKEVNPEGCYGSDLEISMWILKNLPISATLLILAILLVLLFGHETPLWP